MSDQKPMSDQTQEQVAVADRTDERPAEPVKGKLPIGTWVCLLEEISEVGQIVATSETNCCMRCSESGALWTLDWDNVAELVGDPVAQINAWKMQEAQRGGDERPAEPVKGKLPRPPVGTYVCSMENPNTAGPIVAIAKNGCCVLDTQDGELFCMPWEDVAIVVEPAPQPRQAIDGKAEPEPMPEDEEPNAPD